MRFWPIPECLGTESVPQVPCRADYVGTWLGVTGWMCLQSWIYRILAMPRWQEHGVPSFRTGSLSWHFQQFNLISGRGWAVCSVRHWPFLSGRQHSCRADGPPSCKQCRFRSAVHRARMLCQHFWMPPILVSISNVLTKIWRRFVDLCGSTKKMNIGHRNIWYAANITFTNPNLYVYTTNVAGETLHASCLV